MLDNVRIDNAQNDLRKITKKLRKSGDARVIRKRLLAGLKDGVQPAVAKSKAAALALPAKPGGKSTGLRKKLAKVIGPQVRTSGRDPGVRVRISRSRMGEQAALAKVTNIGRWRHPVHGDRKVWVTQTSKAHWFDDANRYSGPPVRRALGKVLTDIERELGK